MIESIAKDETLVKTYPYIGIHSNTLIVLFTSEQVGMVICKNESYYDIGQYRTDWIENDFTVCESSVILRNKK
jgi:hypothetical protein